MEAYSNEENKNLRKDSEAYKLGFEAACEGIDPTKIKLNSEDEINKFLNGYNKALELQQYIDSNQENAVRKIA